MIEYVGKTEFEKIYHGYGYEITVSTTKGEKEYIKFKPHGRNGKGSLCPRIKQYGNDFWIDFSALGMLFIDIGEESSFISNEIKNIENMIKEIKEREDIWKIT